MRQPQGSWPPLLPGRRFCFRGIAARVRLDTSPFCPLRCLPYPMTARIAPPAEDDAIRAFWERRDRLVRVVNQAPAMLKGPEYDAQAALVRSQPGYALSFTGFAAVEGFKGIEAAYARNGAGLRLWCRKDRLSTGPIMLQVLRLEPLANGATGLVAMPGGAFPNVEEARLVASALFAADPALQLGRQAALLCGLSSRGTARHARLRRHDPLLRNGEDSAAA